MNQDEYTADLFVYEDGTLAVHGGTVRGLVIETGSIEKMRKELFRVVPQLLRSNHGLTDKEIENVTLRLVRRNVDDSVHPTPKSRAPSCPRLLWEDDPRMTACA